MSIRPRPLFLAPISYLEKKDVLYKNPIGALVVVRPVGAVITLTQETSFTQAAGRRKIDRHASLKLEPNRAAALSNVKKGKCRVLHHPKIIT